MMMDFVAVLDRWAPETRLYRHATGHVAVQGNPVGPPVPWIVTPMGRIPISSAQIRFHDVAVFLCDERGIAIDADGDPTNGLTPLLTLPPGTTFEQACAAAEPLLAQEDTHNG